MWGLSLPECFQNRHMIHFLDTKHIGPKLVTESHTSARETEKLSLHVPIKVDRMGIDRSL